MKNPYFLVEVYAAKSSFDYPEWYEESKHATLNGAMLTKMRLLKITDEDYAGKPIKRWKNKEVRIVECYRNVIR